MPTAVPPAGGPAPAPAAGEGTLLTGSVRSTGAARWSSVRAVQWTARGTTKVTGAVEVAVADLRGVVTVGGPLALRKGEVVGSLRVDRDVRVYGSLAVRGSLSVGGAVAGVELRVAGSADVKGPTELSGLCDVRGGFRTEGNVRADVFAFEGRVSIRGRLAARSVVGAIGDRSTVTEIVAPQVELRAARARLPLPFPIPFLPPPPWRDLEVERIEATEARLSDVRVQFLRAERIWLGPNSHVQSYEGTIVERHKTAHVGPESETPPPYGLTR